MTISNRLSLFFFSALFMLTSSASYAEATRIYLDFGFGWDLHRQGPGEVGSHACDGLRLKGCGGASNPLTQAGLIWGSLDKLPNAIMPLSHMLLENRLDDPDFEGFNYDGQWIAEPGDALALARDIQTLVEEYYVAFDVEVIRSDAANLDEVAEILESRPTKDVYVFVAGLNEQNGGIATFDWRNQQDNIAFVFAGNSIGSHIGANEYLIDVELIAGTVAHEAGHTFGLTHTGDNSSPKIEDGDFMSHFDKAGSRILRYPTPWSQGTLQIANSYGADFVDDYQNSQGLPFAQTRQNAFQVLKDALGLRPGSPAYVTGTGLHDKITLSTFGSWAYVQIKSYTDSQRTQLHATYAYWISTSQGVYIDGANGDDWISVGNGSFAAEIRGGVGNDVIRGGAGPDRIHGGQGNDEIRPGLGNDTIVFGGPAAIVGLEGEAYAGSFYTSALLGTDTLIDAGGTDTLDFSDFPEGVNVDLTDTGVQRIDDPNTPTFPSFCFRSCPPPPADPARLEIQIQSSGSGFAIENVTGSQFADSIEGTAGRNRLFGLGGNDILEGAGGHDDLIGGTGSDRCYSNGISVLCTYSMSLAPTQSVGPIGFNLNGR